MTTKHSDFVSETIKDRVIRNGIKMAVKTKVSKLSVIKDAYYYAQLLPWTKMVNGVIIDICTVCNARCVYCLHQRNHWVEPQFMDYGIFQSIIEILAKEDFKLVYLFLSGEPFLHPHIYTMMLDVIESGLDISMATRLNKKVDFGRLDTILRLAEYRKRHIGLLITIDSFEHPEVISPGMDKELIIANIKKLAQFRHYKSATFMFSSLVTRANENELDSIKAKLAFFGFDNWYPANISYYMSKDATPENLRDLQDFRPENPLYRERFDIIDGKVVGRKHSCGCMIPNISPIGDVSICFYDMLHKVNTGNILESNSLRQILNGQKYREATRLGRDMKLNICEGCN